jgi:hypothetical protein
LLQQLSPEQCRFQQPQHRCYLQLRYQWMQQQQQLDQYLQQQLPPTLQLVMARLYQRCYCCLTPARCGSQRCPAHGLPHPAAAVLAAAALVAACFAAAAAAVPCLAAAAAAVAAWAALLCQTALEHTAGGAHAHLHGKQHSRK